MDPQQAPFSFQENKNTPNQEKEISAAIAVRFHIDLDRINGRKLAEIAEELHKRGLQLDIVDVSVGSVQILFRGANNSIEKLAAILNRERSISSLPVGTWNVLPSEHHILLGQRIARNITVDYIQDADSQHLGELLVSLANDGHSLYSTEGSFYDFTGSVLIGQDLNHADLFGVVLVGADLSKANLEGANLIGADLRTASLVQSNLSRADLSSANLSRADLSNSLFEETNLRKTVLSRANLSYANLDVSMLHHTDLSGADLTNTTFRGATLFDVDLSGATLRGVDFSNARIRNIQAGQAVFDFDTYSTGNWGEMNEEILTHLVLNGMQLSGFPEDVANRLHLKAKETENRLFLTDE